MQRDFLTVVSPIQDGANKALKPVRDTFGWFGETLHAKGQRDELRKQIDKLRPRAGRRRRPKNAPTGSCRRSTTSTSLGVGDYHPVTATVVGKSPNIWYSTVTIDTGTPDGVRVNDPVVNGEGLVGKVAQVELRRRPGRPDHRQHDGRLGAHRHEHRDRDRAAQGRRPRATCCCSTCPPSTQPNNGEYVVTSGTVASPDDSLYPPGLLIGQVTSVNEESGYKSVNVRPVANLHNLDVVQVLTSRAGSRAVEPRSLAATLPAGQGRPGAEASGEQHASTGSGG